MGLGTFTGAIMVAAGSGNATDLGASHTCALKSAQTVWCWGGNLHGCLGDGSTTSSSTPVQVKGPGGTGSLANIAWVGAGDAYTCALTRVGVVYCWGKNDEGQLGNGSSSESSLPVAVSGLAEVTQLSIGVAHACARVAGGAAYCWGRNTSGQLGTSSTAAYVATPTRVAGEGCSGLLADAQYVAAGGQHSCALHADGGYRCWGGNDCCEVSPTGQGTASRCPRALLETSGVERIVVGEQHHCVEKAGGELWCRGPNQKGENGDYYTACTSASTPCATTTLTRVVGAAPLTGAAEVAVGPQHTCVRKTDGSVWCAGSNQKLELGVIPDTAPADPALPVPPSGLVYFTVARPVYADQSTYLTGTSLLVSGQYHTCATKDGSVYCWGGTSNGEGGNETSSTLYPAPTLVTRDVFVR